jgi:ABC-2 type transport system ATP-binding protein
MNAAAATSAATMAAPFAAHNITKRYDKQVALKDVTLEIPAGRIVGLLGRNGAGKTTFLNIVSGIVLPSAGTAETFGVPTDRLDTPQLTRLGVVQQEGGTIGWMTVRQHLDFNASFYPTWDRDLEQRLLGEFELDPKRKIVQLSTGDRQKVGLLLGVCHRPGFLVLDEPMSALDPIIRTRALDLLLERLRDDGCTVLVSSHILNDVEKIVDWVICLDQGKVVANAAFDSLQEAYAEWILSSPAGALPTAFSESFVLSYQGNERQARLRVCTNESDAAEKFAAAHGAQVQKRPLNLEEMFPLLTSRRKDGR